MMTKSTNKKYKTIQEIYDDLWDLLELIGFFNLKGNDIDYQIKALYEIEQQRKNEIFYFDIYYNPISKDYVFSVEPNNLEKYHGISTHFKNIDMKEIEQELYNNYKFIKTRQYNLFDFI